MEFRKHLYLRVVARFLDGRKDPHLPGVHTPCNPLPHQQGQSVWLKPRGRSDDRTGHYFQYWIMTDCSLHLGCSPSLGSLEWPAAIAWGHSGGLWKALKVKNGGLWPMANRNWDLPLPWGRAWMWVFPVMIQPSEKPWVKPPSYTVLNLIPRKWCESTSWIYLLFKFLVMCYTATDN